MKLIHNDLVEVTDRKHPLFGMIGTVCSNLGHDIYTVRVAWNAVNLDGRKNDKEVLHGNQLTKRGHADWRD